MAGAGREGVPGWVRWKSVQGGYIPPVYLPGVSLHGQVSLSGTPLWDTSLGGNSEVKRALLGGNSEVKKRLFLGENGQNKLFLGENGQNRPFWQEMTSKQTLSAWNDLKTGSLS